MKTKLLAFAVLLGAAGCPGSGDSGTQGDDGGGDDSDAGTDETPAAPWSRMFAGPGADDTTALAFLPDGGLVVAGNFSAGPVDVGGGPIAHVGYFDAYLAAYGPDGTYRWSRTIVGPDYDGFSGMAIDDAGDVLVTGVFSQSMNLDGTTHVAVGDHDGFVAKLSGTTGAGIWSRRFGGAEWDQGYDIASDGTDAYVTGQFYGDVDFGGGVRTSDGTDAFVLRLAGDDGAHVWSTSFGGASADHGAALALTPDGNVLVTGEFYETMNAGGADLVSDGRSDVFVVTLAGNNGAHERSVAYGGSTWDSGLAISVGADGGYAVAGSFSGAANFGGGYLETGIIGYETDAFVARYGPTGNHLLSLARGEPSDYDDAVDVAILSDGDMLVGVHEGGAVATRIAPNGTTRWSWTYSGTGFVWAPVLAARGDRFAIGAAFYETIDLGEGPRTAGAGRDRDGFVMVRNVAEPP